MGRVYSFFGSFAFNKNIEFSKLSELEHEGVGGECFLVSMELLQEHGF